SAHFEAAAPRAPGLVKAYSRRYSTIRREVLETQVVYVKQYLEGDWGCTGDVIRARAAREGEVIGRLGELPGLSGRLGSMRLVSADPEQATVVTAAVGGRPLDEYARDEYRRYLNGPCLRAFFLAGKWLSVFQTLHVLPGDGERTGEYDPEDLVEYCDIRLKKTRSLGYRWLTEAVRDRVCGVVGGLVERSPEEDRRRVWSHHDYGPGNVMWDGTTLTAIDFAMASLDVPLVDVTYFIHRLEMMPIYFPWKRWPVAVWKRAFLRGYGRPDAEASPMYRALMIRHLLCRLQTYVRRPPENLKQRIHNAWVRRCVRAKLIGMLD
ncbi:MAG: phosphotransferase, partial [Planctomycetota bacterium]